MRDSKNPILLVISTFLITIFLSLSIYALVSDSAPEWQKSGLKTNLAAPGDVVGADNILVYKDHIFINQSNVSYFTVKPTKSMLPLFDNGNYILGINVTTDKQLKIGDIITYNSTQGEYIIHRIVKIDNDSQGVYYTLKGDNNLYQDSDKVRLGQIRFRTIGIIY